MLWYAAYNDAGTIEFVLDNNNEKGCSDLKQWNSCYSLQLR